MNWRRQIQKYMHDAGLSTLSRARVPASGGDSEAASPHAAVLSLVSRVEAEKPVRLWRRRSWRWTWRGSCKGCRSGPAAPSPPLAAATWLGRCRSWSWSSRSLRKVAILLRLSHRSTTTRVAWWRCRRNFIILWQLGGETVWLSLFVAMTVRLLVMGRRITILKHYLSIWIMRFGTEYLWCHEIL
jgi:hypothetical protein